jgi:hypothetical protein
MICFFVLKTKGKKKKKKGFVVSTTRCIPIYLVFGGEELLGTAIFSLPSYYRICQL